MMADLVETATYSAGIYQIETTDPVVGGLPDEATKSGLSNIPHLQLAKRTAWLKEQVEALAADLAAALTETEVNALIEFAAVQNAQTSDMDATASRVLLTGAGGLLATAAGPLLANLNATTIPGSLARFDGTTTGTKPPGVATGTVLTKRGAGTNNLSQLVVSANGLAIWSRACVAGLWGAWGKPSPPELSQIQAESATGVNSTPFGTVNGLRLAQAIAKHAIGVGQTLQDATASRAVNTSYQNTTGRPISVTIKSTGGTTSEFQYSTNGTTWTEAHSWRGGTGASELSAVTVIIPAGNYYRKTGNFNEVTWTELR
jgi:hypothetical protein